MLHSVMNKKLIPYLIVVTALLVIPSSLIYAEAPKENVISFAKGKWDSAQWLSLRLPNQEHAVPLVQNPSSLGTTDATFTETDYGKERDNALLQYDMGTSEGQIELTFSLGKGFNHYSSPGICLFPKVKDGTFETGIAAFVSSYGMDLWYEYGEGSVMKYRNIGQLARWTTPFEKHILRCHFSKAKRSIALQVDNSDIVVFLFVGDPRLSFIPQEINSLIALWGCHGVCDFYSLKIIDAQKTPDAPGLLPFYAKDPSEKNPSPGK
ncbi:MAG: hypothetical protein ABI443_12670 [Chthoniobacterales bacterium]